MRWRLARWVVAAVAVGVAATAAGAGYLYYLARRAEPVYSGKERLPGLAARVVVTFGPHAVPHVKATTQEDALFAQGYLVARERLWQMDVARHLARGRLSEVLGERAVPVDRLFRTLGLQEAAERQAAALDASVRRLGDAYVRGVNAYIASARGRMPLEYIVAGFEPAPWEITDSCAIGEFMSFALSTNLREELVYLRLARRLGARRAAELFPMEEGVPAALDEVAGLPALAASVDDALAPYEHLAERFGLPRLAPVSNNWAVSAEHTTSGLPVVCNDPHLPPSMPSIWYEQELEAPGLHVQGISVPGIPLVLIGHNEHVGWGLTTVTADTQDIVVERFDAAGTAVERADGSWEPVRTEEQHIAAKGRPVPHVLTIRRTSHGVLLNDVTGEQPGSSFDLVEVPTTYGLALRSNFEVTDRAFEGAYRLAQARTGDDVRRAAVLFTHASQNFVFAVADGTIGWKVSGRLPLRSKGSGTFPVPGWTGEYAWTGFVPPEQNPESTNPEGGIIVTANNRTVPLDHPVNVSRSWGPPYRAVRIRELLTARSTFSEGELAAVQLDQTAVQAQRYLEAIRRLDLSHPEAAAVARWLSEWDASFAAGSAHAALFVLLRQALFEAVFGDELGEDLSVYARITPPHYNALEEAVLTGRSSFWDDVGTPNVETAADIWARALVEARRRLDAMGRQTTLGDVHRLVFPHTFHGVPLLGPLFDVGPLGVGGDNYTVNMASTRMTSPQSIVYIPSYRVTMAPGGWERTRGTNTLGQSGHRFSPYRSDQLDDWLAGRTHPWHWGGPPRRERLGVLTLQPAR